MVENINQPPQPARSEDDRYSSITGTTAQPNLTKHTTLQRHSETDKSCERLSTEFDHTSLSLSTPQPTKPLKTDPDHLTSSLQAWTYNEGGSEPSVVNSDILNLSPALQLICEACINIASEKMATNNNSFASLESPIAGPGRAANSTTTSLAGQSTNGNGITSNANYMAPLPIGHQQDLNYLYAQIQELSGVLRSNREKMAVITKTAEEVARRANGANGEGEGSQENDQARIRELEHELSKANHVTSIYKHEQTQNTGLIANYEEALGTATEQIRNYCGGIDDKFLAQRRHYNNLLQQEKDEHLQSRLDRDYWHAQTLKICEMVRTAHRLRMEEWGEEYSIISGLQSEVRCLRRCLGMDPEKPEEETGWPYLKDTPLSDQV